MLLTCVKHINISGEDVAISLWKEFTSASSKFDRIALETATAPVIVAITSVKISTYAGKQICKQKNYH